MVEGAQERRTGYIAERGREMTERGPTGPDVHVALAKRGADIRRSKDFPAPYPL